METAAESSKEGPSPGGILSDFVLWIGTLLLLLCPACSGGDSDDSEGGALPDEPAVGDLITRALPVFKAAKDTAVPAPTPGMMQAAQAFADGDGVKGRLILEDELRLNPANSQARLILSEMLMNKGQFGSACEGFERILEDGPGFPRCEQVFLLYGRCLVRLGEGERARVALEAFEELSPGGGDTQWAFGMLDVQEGRPGEALRRFENALSIYRATARPRVDRARIHAGRADAYLQQGDLENARAALVASARMNPAVPEVHYSLARVLTRLGETAAAEQAMEAFAKAKAALAKGSGSSPANSPPPDEGHMP